MHRMWIHCQSDILTAIATNYDPEVYGRALAEAVEGNFGNPLFNEMRPGRKSLKALLEPARFSVLAQLSSSKIDFPAKRELAKKYLALTSLMDGTPEIQKRFNAGFSSQVGDDYASSWARNIGLEEKAINAMLMGNTYSDGKGQSLQMIISLGKARARTTLLLLESLQKQ